MAPKPSRRAVMIALALAGCASNRVLSPGTAPQAWAALDAAIVSRIRAHHYAGAVFAVARRDRLLHQAALGLADIDAHLPMRMDTMFAQASLTKPVTAVGAMILVDAGQLDLDAPVSRYLPELSDYVFDGVAVTSRHLLTHTSGFGVFGSIPPPTPGLTLEARVRQLGAKRPLIRPGTRWEYSGFDGFDILARIIEVRSGSPYAEYMQRRVFDPLNMRDSTFAPTPGQRTRLARLYGERDGALEPATSPFTLPAYPAGGAGLYSSAPDMLRFAQMLANNGALNGRRILSGDAVAQMRSEQLPSGFPGLNAGMAWGLGVRVVDDPATLHSALSRGAFGWSGAYGAHLWVDPSTGVAAVWMISTATGGGAGSPHAEDYERLVMQALSAPASGR